MKPDNSQAPAPTPTGALVPLGQILGALFDTQHQNPDAPENDAPSTGAPECDKPKAKGRAKLEKAAAHIRDYPDQAQKAYLARQVVQCSLPRSNPGDKTVFVRRNGNFSLVLEALTDPETLQSVGLPSGSIAKILWLWINTEAVFNKNSAEVKNKYRLAPGRTLKAFLLSLGLDPNTGGGKWSHARAVKEELTKLLRCHISFHYSGGDGTKGRKSFVNMPIARSATLWWDLSDPETGELECEIILDEAFFEAITAVSVPVDLRVVVALMRSPLAIDLYTWATYRVFSLQQTESGAATIALSALKEQFGAEYNRADNFKAALEKALQKIKAVWPEFDYSLGSKALTLRVAKNGPSIAPRGQKRRAPALDAPNRISAPMRQKFEQQYPLHDVDEIFAAFDQWRTNRDIVSRDTDRHFWDFVTKHYFKH